MESTVDLATDYKILAIYYSFVTMTTIGFGDVVPTTPLARMCSVVQGISGQIYLTVLVARLVGLHIAEATVKRDSH